MVSYLSVLYFGYFGLTMVNLSRFVTKATLFEKWLLYYIKIPRRLLTARDSHVWYMGDAYQLSFSSA